jgi:ElaA protein
VPKQEEMDPDDKHAIHFLAFAGVQAIGTARVVMHQGSAKVGRMAVLKSHRRKGVGTKLLKRAIGTAQKRGARRIYLHAQVSAIGFYRAMRFSCVGPVFHEAGIPHQKMIMKVR